MVGVGRGSFLRLVRSKSEPPPSPREPSDPLASLAKAAAEGDGAAIRTFLSSVGACLLRVVRSVLGAQHPDVDDVVQEAAFAVIDGLPLYRGESSVLTFVYRVAALTAMQVRRREAAQKRAGQRVHGLELDELVAAVRSPDEELSS